MTNFEKATRNVLLWRVPGQPAASQGRNERYVEMVDFFPTVIDVMGLPKIPRCSGVDQPPTVLCLQGESYADEFTAELGVGPSVPKKSIFSQWPYSAIQSPGYKGGDRMAYTVRTADGYRLTQYVPYLVPFGGRAGRGLWADVKGTDDLELYDYTTDPHETTNQAANPKYAGIVARLQAVLREQYDPSE